jgi:hypothetical protein
VTVKSGLFLRLGHGDVGEEIGADFVLEVQGDDFEVVGGKEEVFAGLAGGGDQRAQAFALGKDRRGGFERGDLVGEPGGLGEGGDGAGKDFRRAPVGDAGGLRGGQGVGPDFIGARGQDFGLLGLQGADDLS